MGRPRKHPLPVIGGDIVSEPLTAENDTVLSPTVTVQEYTAPILERRYLRDQDCLLKGVDYKYKPNGFVDWRKMIPVEYVVLNREKFLKKDNPKDVDKLSDDEYNELLAKADEKDKLIKLAGLKEVAQIRGYLSLNTSVKDFSHSTVAECTIEWMPNFETSFEQVVSTGVGEAHGENTHGLGSKYLAAIAENRAVSRCIRNFLMIHTVADEEVKFQNTDEFGDKKDLKSGPQAVVDTKLREAKKGFPEFQQYILDKAKDGEFVGAETWESTSDMSAQDATVAIGMLSGFLKK
jgi:hypothetical protein